MYDRALVFAVLTQIAEALEKVQARTTGIRSAEDLIKTPEGMEKLDGVCMLFLAIGESIKNLDKITHGELVKSHPAIDWKGIMGFRDVIAHHYFDIDAEQVFWFCKHLVNPLLEEIRQIRETVK